MGFDPTFVGVAGVLNFFSFYFRLAAVARLPGSAGWLPSATIASSSAAWGYNRK